MARRPSPPARERPGGAGAPDRSPHADEVLRAELRDASGRDPDSVPVRVRRGTTPRLLAQASALRYLTAVLIGTGLVGISLLILLLGGALWALIPLAIMVGVLIALVGWVLRSTTDVEALSPEHRAALEEEGVVDPDHELNVRVRHLDGEAPPASLPTADRTTRPEDDPALAAHEQQDAWTPGSGPSRRIGR